MSADSLEADRQAILDRIARYVPPTDTRVRAQYWSRFAVSFIAMGAAYAALAVVFERGPPSAVDLREGALLGAFLLSTIASMRVTVRAIERRIARVSPNQFDAIVKLCREHSVARAHIERCRAPHGDLRAIDAAFFCKAYDDLTRLAVKGDLGETRQMEPR